MSHTKTDELILTIYTLYDVFLCKELPFDGRNDCTCIKILVMLIFLIMVALWNRADHYIFMLWFVLLLSFFLFFSSPNLSSRRLDVYHTATHGVAVVRI